MSTGIDQVAHLDFPTPVVCHVEECSRDQINAQVAVATVTQTTGCCVQTAPICAVHIFEIHALQLAHRLIVCPQHRVGSCSCTALTVRPLT